MLSPDVRWEIPQTIDTIDPNSSHYNAKSAYAKTLRRDEHELGRRAGFRRIVRENSAHDNSNVSCQICHPHRATKLLLAVICP